jgi:hypothetical protein
MWITSHVAEIAGSDQVVLAQHLLRGKARPVPEAGGPVERRCRHGGLNEVAAGNHVFNLRIYSGF